MCVLPGDIDSGKRACNSLGVTWVQILLCFSQAIRYFGKKNDVSFLNISFFIYMEMMETGNNFYDYYFHPDLVLRN